MPRPSISPALDLSSGHQTGSAYRRCVIWPYVRPRPNTLPSLFRLILHAPEIDEVEEEVEEEEDGRITLNNTM